MSVTRLEGREKVTGKAVFAGDLKLDGLLMGKILRSKVAHARIKHIDTTLAKQLPGVMAVITGRDFPDARIGFIVIDEVAMARDKIRYIGEPVAAVAAIDQATAERALDLIKVELEELPGIFSVEEALKDDCPQIHEDLMNYATAMPVRRYGNVVTHATVKKGNIDSGFAESELIIEDVFSLPLVHQAPMEPKSVVAHYDVNGNLTVWCGTQSSYGVKGDLASYLGLPMGRIRVTGVRVGGGFGGKTRATIEPVASLLAMKSQHPVKIEMSREDDFVAANPRHAMKIWVKTGVKRDGTLVAKQAKVLLDTGAYANFGPITASWASTLITGPYRIPNLLLEGICVYTNTISCGACRAPAAPQTNFTAEVQMDRIARELGLSPYILRQRNALKAGDDTATGQVLTDYGYDEVLHRLELAAKEQLDNIPKNPGMARGVGMAGSFWGMSGFGSSAMIRVNEDGTVILNMGAVDIGTGADTAMALIIAQELGIGLDKIKVVGGDTDSGPYDFGAVGSRTTSAMGNAVYKAVQGVKQQLLSFAAEQLNVPVESLTLDGEFIFDKNDPTNKMPIAGIVPVMCRFIGGPVVASASHATPYPAFDSARLDSHTAPSEVFYMFGAQAVAVDVDPADGRVNVLRVIAVHDVGKAVFPAAIEGQIQGGVAMGLGYALSEEAIFQNGKIINPNFLDYRVPTMRDVPEIVPIVLEKPNAKTPYDIRGIGEPPIIPTAAAVANAVHDAVGVRLNVLPLTPERIYDGLRANHNKDKGNLLQKGF